MQMKFNLLSPENGVELSLGVSFSKNCGVIERIFDADVDALAAFDAFCAVKLDIVFCRDVFPSPTPQCEKTTIFRENKLRVCNS